MYGFKILCEISKMPFEISLKILNSYKICILRGVKNITIYDILELWYSKYLNNLFHAEVYSMRGLNVIFVNNRYKIREKIVCVITASHCYAI